MMKTKKEKLKTKLMKKKSQKHKKLPRLFGTGNCKLQKNVKKIDK